MTNKEKFTILYKSLRYDSVAQLDRVTDYESVGLGFESLPGHHSNATRTPCQHFVDGVFEYIGDRIVIVVNPYLVAGNDDTTDKGLERIEPVSVVFLYHFFRKIFDSFGRNLKARIQFCRFQLRF